MDKYRDLFAKLLPLHEMRIEETLNQSAIDLNEFLDYTQARLNLFTENHFEATRFREKNPGVGWFDHTQAIADTKKIQGVVIEMLSSQEKNILTHPQNALYHIYERKELPSDSITRLQNVYGELNKPGTIGEKNRRCSGKKKRSLTTRLNDFETIKPLLSEEGLKRLLVDEKAISKEIEEI